MRYSSPPSHLFFYSNLSMPNKRGRGLLRRRFSARLSTERRFGNQDQTIGYREDPGFYGTQQPPPHFRPRSSSGYGFRPPHPHFDNPQFHAPSPNSQSAPQFHIPPQNSPPPPWFNAHSQNSHFVNRPPPQFHVHSQNSYPPPRFHAHSQNSHFVNRLPSQFQVPPPLKQNTVHRPPQQFHPSPQRAHYHQPSCSSAPFNRPMPDDYRIWVPSKSQPSPYCEHFRLVSYNILADYLARDHQSQLYFHIPPQVLDWEWRKHNILSELQSWSPDILCLQEVDKFQDLLDDLSLQGYDGIWQMRTGTAIDGCAIFWRINRFRLIHEEHIEFKKHGLQDNVAQICVLESWAQRHVDLNSAGSSESHNRLQKHNRIVVCNIHVLYNPKRGEIKLGQVRILLDQAYSISRQLNAPVVLCGDFNCTPKSPLYNFLSDQMLNLSGLDRNQVSGQNSACIQEPPKHYPNFRLHSNDIKRCVGDYAEMQYRRLDNISPRRREESQEVSVSLKMEIHQEVKHNDLHTKSVSGYHREIELLKHHVKDHDEINNVAHGSESIGNHQHVGEPITENASSVIISEKYSVEVLKENADEDILLQNLEDKLSNTLLNLDSCMDSTVVQESASLSSTVTNKPNDIDSEENPINSVCQPAEKSSVKLELDLSESVQRESKINRDSLPDNPDPKFLAELHGSEENQIIDSNFQYDASFHQSDSGFQTSGTYNPYAFTPKQAELASGNANCSLLQHNLKLKSAYTEVEDCGGTRDSNGEPQVTSYNRKFMGTVDYIWFSEGIQTTKVLDTIRRDVLQKTPGFPTRKWGSDHLALACEFAFT